VLVNERAVGITPAQPQQINPNYTANCAHVRVISSAGTTLASFRIYGALTEPGAAAPTHFPPLGTAAEAVAESAAGIGVGAGVVRQLSLKESDAGVRRAASIVPNWLLLEYTTAGAAGALVFEVWLTLLGPMIGGVE
jgi:hypothetical protein